MALKAQQVSSVPGKVKGHLKLSVGLNLDLNLNLGCHWGSTEETAKQWWQR